MNIALAGFEKAAFAGGAVLYDAHWQPIVDADMFDPGSPVWTASPVTEGGRQAAWFVSGAKGDAVLRHYRRGGLMGRVNADRYVWLGEARTRPFAELRVLGRLHARGLAVPRPLAAAYWRAGCSYRAAILTQRIPAVHTLAERVRAESDLDDSRPALIRGVAAAIRTMHDEGVWHADLNCHNILIDDLARVWLIDFDKARVGVVSARERRVGLLRLRRSLNKIAPEKGDLWWKRINHAYYEM